MGGGGDMPVTVGLLCRQSGGLPGWRWQAVPHPLRLSTKAPCYWGLEAEVPISRVIAELIGQLGGSCPGGLRHWRCPRVTCPGTHLRPRSEEAVRLASAAPEGLAWEHRADLETAPQVSAQTVCVAADGPGLNHRKVSVTSRGPHVLTDTQTGGCAPPVPASGSSAPTALCYHPDARATLELVKGQLGRWRGGALGR